MWWYQFIDWLRFETRPSSLLNFGTAYLPSSLLKYLLAAGQKDRSSRRVFEHTRLHGRATIFGSHFRFQKRNNAQHHLPSKPSFLWYLQTVRSSKFKARVFIIRIFNTISQNARSSDVGTRNWIQRQWNRVSSSCKTYLIQFAGAEKASLTSIHPPVPGKNNLVFATVCHGVLLLKLFVSTCTIQGSMPWFARFSLLLSLLSAQRFSRLVLLVFFSLQKRISTLRL